MNAVGGEQDAFNAPALLTEKGGYESERRGLSVATSRRWDHRWVVTLAGAMAALALLLVIAQYFVEVGKVATAAEVWQQLEGGGRLLELLGKADRQLPVFAFFITGTQGEVASMQRVLYAVYHPRNEYLLHFDGSAPAEEHAAVAQFVRDERAFAEAENVRVVTRPNAVTYKGASITATTLHGIALLLRQRADWDWFVNLSATDYPLVTPDGMAELHLQATSGNLMFVDSEFSSGEKELVPVKYNRSMPTAFNQYKGSAWVVLSRAFSEYTIFGYENFPRTLLLYFANSLSSTEHYFQTLICNSRVFNSSVVNMDLHHVKWEGGQHPLTLNTSHFPLFAKRGIPFARKFGNGSEEVLAKIDQELLYRGQSRFVRGGWCVGPLSGGRDPCDTIGDLSVLNITDNVKRFEQRIHDFSNPKVYPKCMQLFKLLAEQSH